MVFRWSDSKSQIFKSLLSILADFNLAVVCIVSILPLILRFLSLFSRCLEIVPKASTTIDITVIFMFHSLFSSPTRSKYLYIFSPSFIFTQWSVGIAKSTHFFVNTRSSLLTWIGWSICISSGFLFLTIFSNSLNLSLEVSVQLFFFHFRCLFVCCFPVFP